VTPRDGRGGPRTVVIDCFPESVPEHRNADALVGVDVIRATTTAVTAVAGGRRCFPVASLEAAFALRARLDDPLLVGELGGHTPHGFDLTNSPAELAERRDIARPAVLLSTSGTKLLCQPSPDQAVYAACLRNVTAQAEALAAHHQNVAIIGAGARGEFRREDQLACAWIAGLLMEAGYRPLGTTRGIVDRWRDAAVEVIASGNSAGYLRRSGQLRDLEFVLSHIDDIDDTFAMTEGELVNVPGAGELPNAPAARSMAS
jgi:2-phosphosulfolactate phosphatase